MPLIRSKKTTHIKITDTKFKLKTNFQTEILAQECEPEMLSSSHCSFSEEMKIFVFSNSSILVLHNCTDRFISLYYTCDLKFHFEVLWLKLYQSTGHKSN